MTDEKRWLVVTGGRDFNDWQLLVDEIERVVELFRINAIAHGGARGADSMAKNWWEIEGYHHGVYEMKSIPADWAKYGRAAGPIRNKQMLESLRPKLVLAFPGGRGTRNCVEQARAMGLMVSEVKE